MTLGFRWLQSLAALSGTLPTQVERGYELIKKLAGGGMGEVFVARLMGTGNFEKRVALKLLLPHLATSSELVHRFHDEARLAARMHHPNIVEIFDVGEADGRPFIAMQLVDGVTLSQLLRDLAARNEQLPLPMARLIAIGLCEALTYAHGLTDGQGRLLNLIHRDVTPSNVLVSRNGAVLLTDFGIARVRDSEATSPGVLRGKAPYLAPEQILHDAPVDARVDIYSAGLMLYELLTGTHPHKRESMSESLAAVRLGQVTPAEMLRPEITPGIASGLRRALARKPADRFASAKELREAFSDGPVATSPELAEFIRSRCGEGHNLESESDAAPGTRSVVALTVTQVQPLLPRADRPVQRRRSIGWWAVLPLLVFAMALVVGLKTIEDRRSTVSAVLPEPPVPQPALTEALVDEATAPVVTVDSPAPATPVVDAPSPVAPEEAATPPPHRMRPTRTMSRPRKPVLPVTPVGYVTADASPWAEVLLEGRVIERTPFVRFPLPVGTYELVFRAPSGATQVREVRVKEGQITAVRVDF